MSSPHEGRIKSWRDLKCWQLARRITRSVYNLTRLPPFSHDFELCRQVRRSAISIMSNIPEGFERGGNREFHNFLSIAKGSCGELESQLVAALDQRFISREQYQALVDMIREESRLIWGLMQSLNKSTYRGVKYKTSMGSANRKTQS